MLIGVREGNIRQYSCVIALNEFQATLKLLQDLLLAETDCITQ